MMSSLLADQIRAVADDPTPDAIKQLRELAVAVQRMEITLDELVAIELVAERLRQWNRRAEMRT